MNLSNEIRHTGLSPIIKWAGGKERELPFVFSNLPAQFNNYYEPFVGGGSVFAALPAREYFINDASCELIALYRCIASHDTNFYKWLHDITSAWKTMLSFAGKHDELCELYCNYRNEGVDNRAMKSAVLSFVGTNDGELRKVLPASFQWHRDVYTSELKRNLSGKLARMKRIEKERGEMPDGDISDNIETALMASLYMYFRCLYNDYALMQSDNALSSAVFVFIRNYAYSGMFRYNANGEFNVPYGGMGYNCKSLEKKVEYYKSEALSRRLKTTNIFNADFEDFLTSNPPQPNDFVFLDPPYDSTFSTYAKNDFSQNDHRRLASYLLSECRGKWMMVIKNTPFIRSLYNDEKLTVKSYDKKYTVSFMNRNDKQAEHLIITNYET